MDEITHAGRTGSLTPLGIVEVLLLARQLGALDLATGAPSYPATPSVLVDSACDAIRSGYNQYDDPAGNADLRAAAAALHGADPDTEITVTAGSTEGVNIVLQSLVEAGDEVVVFEPYYEAYPAAINLSGARPRFVRLHEPGWLWRPEELAAAFGPRTRAVIVNSPHNPTGCVFTAAQLAEIVRLCAKWNAVLISDEVYAELVENPETAPRPERVPGAAERLVVLRSLSKSHAIGGWRIGWIFAPPPLTRTFRMVHETLLAGVAAPLQVAAAAILRDRPGWTADQRAQLADNRQLIISALRDAGIRCHPPEGSCFLLARLPDDTTEDANEFARTLIRDVGVAAAPGDLFFHRRGDGSRYLRFGYNKAAPVMADAARRLRDLAAGSAPSIASTVAHVASGSEHR